MDETSVRNKMQSALVAVNSDIAGVRTGRASPSLVENIVCPAYGGTQRLKILETKKMPLQIIQFLI